MAQLEHWLIRLRADVTTGWYVEPRGLLARVVVPLSEDDQVDEQSNETLKQGGRMHYPDSDFDLRTHLDSGEPVDAYIRRKLPTIEDRVEAYRRYGDSKRQREREAYLAYLDEANRHAKRDRLLYGAWITLLSSVGLSIAAMLVVFSEGGFGWNRESAITVSIILLISLSFAWLGTRDDARREAEFRHSQQRRTIEKPRNSPDEADVERLRTGWLPNTVSSLSRLGLDPYTDTAPSPTASPTYTDYQAYLRSPHWKRTREEALRRAGYRCQLDATHTSRLEVHHNTYVRLGQEQPEDLVVLCAACHRRFHANGNMPGR